MIDLCELSAQYIKTIAPYQPGKPMSELQRELGLSTIIKLASNENPLGPSPLALAAIQTALKDLALYPDGNGFELKSALAQLNAVELNNIVLGNGSNDVLELVARAFLSHDTEAIYSQYAFAVYPLVTQATGAKGIVVPAKEYGHDLAAMLSAITAKTRVIFVANPNNPTGHFIHGEQIKAFLKAVPSQILVVLDEAYTEYLDNDLTYDAISWLREFDNLIITRSFSKAYGLAGLRVGCGFAHSDVIALMNRVRQPFNVNQLALVAAEAALHDQEFLHKTKELNTAGLRQLESACTELGLRYLPSRGNFLAIEVGHGALEIYQQLLNRGVIVRPVANYQLPTFLRVSVGLASENQFFIDQLSTIIKP
ncbi:MAG: histidinol-phosphate transaminase [Ferrovum sp. 37-45-19]|uniref:histidinol-phosphate transaminase n=1 Tax=Ferrovum sp. JA12 TaxID=1356299 RepID=UPI000702BDDD|nr:histidinol-phosphate transaminase [Ferrovum sp. JA12]OYV79027.1 MAG: histidinol-phosphate transaminase [Ferrovum sp. 21-44-67]OYV93821.1 MAG: histidinol-phosphate transaminase [Ferrovum sp. 37-45-19]OZB32068.1 MAG: histidinol-phosphate transaminase [Ferrovum sp. 34-44-207]HQT82137.1 histidinol-phosphate transaminase [Ferrovaceae bacterium]KRH78628.1 histidinol-phosphate aminotransferase 2 [Ferrovum sp. JA12]